MLHVQGVEGRVPVPLGGARRGNGTNGAAGDDSAVDAVRRGRRPYDVIEKLAWFWYMTLKGRGGGGGVWEDEGEEGGRGRGRQKGRQDEYIYQE